MSQNCIFYLSGQSQKCEIMKTLKKQSLPVDVQEFLEASYCTSEAFTNCPIYWQLQLYLSRKKTRLNIELTHLSP